MSANTHTTEPEERKPPTIADIVREKTGDGALIIDFFTDVMTGRIEGAELCHRIDAAKQLVKYGSKDAAEFIAKYKGVPCGHSTRGRPNQADPCSAEERTLVAVTLNAPPTLTRDFLTVLSGIDEFLMARLIRAQTADGVTVIEFLDDVMQDRSDGFKTHHRIAAAKELIVHIIRDEQPSHTPSPSTTPSPLMGEGWGEGDPPPLPQGEGWGEGDSPVVGADPRVRPLPGSKTPSPSTGEGGACPESPRRSEGDSPVVPAEAGTQGGGGGRSTVANSAHPEPSSTVIPAKAGIQGGGGARNTAANPARTEPIEGSVRAEPVLSTAEGSVHPEPVEGPRPEFTEGPADSSSVVPAKEPAEEPALPSLPQLTTLKQHWHEPDPHGAPIDSTHSGRSPPR